MIEYNKINGYIDDVEFVKQYTDINDTRGYSLYRMSYTFEVHFKCNGEHFTMFLNSFQIIKDTNIIIFYLQYGDWIGFRIHKNDYINLT